MQKTSEIRRDFEQLQSLIANISGRNGDIKNRKTKWSTTTPTPPMFGDKNLVNFGPLQKKLQARMLTHPRSTLRELRRLRQLRSGHVTLLREKFEPSKLSPQSDLRPRAAVRWALPQISSLYIVFLRTAARTYLYRWSYHPWARTQHCRNYIVPCQCLGWRQCSCCSWRMSACCRL